MLKLGAAFAGGRGRKVRGGVLAVVAAAGALGLALIQGLSPAFAEFEIAEVDIDKGSIEAEYRGASHWRLPEPTPSEEIEALRQSHELEIQFGITAFRAVRVTPERGTA
jgi:Zn-dependent alcohol dehydrogenase